MGLGGVSASANSDAHVVLDDVGMCFGEREVLSNLSCAFPRGKISIVLGGSGSGKSTTLRLIAGLVRPGSGRVLVDGTDVGCMYEYELRQMRRKVGMMFQGGALLDSMTVFDNVALPLREHSNLAASGIADAVHSCLASVGLTKVDQLLPGELSGGMLKRVALARALVQQPVIVLVDEAFSGLDPVSVKLIEALLVRINRQYDMTMIMVSHHIPSTMRMADKVVLLLPDCVEQGTPNEVAHSPNARVRRFFNEELEDSYIAQRPELDFESEIVPARNGIR